MLPGPYVKSPVMDEDKARTGQAMVSVSASGNFLHCFDIAGVEK